MRIETLWSRWLGREGKPPPLDRFLSGALRGEREGERAAVAMFEAAAWAVTALAAQRVDGARGFPDDAPALVDALRRADARALLDATAALAAGKPSLALRARLDELRAQGHVGRLLAAGIPPWYAEELAAREASWGTDRLEAWLIAQNRRPPLWLRPREPGLDVLGPLRADGFEVVAEGGPIRVVRGPGIERAESWRSGLIEVQDIGSQVVGAAVEARPGQTVWDMCAGAGGKTLQIAGRMGGRGSILASDVEERRISTLKQRVKRAGWQNVRGAIWTGETTPELGPEVRKRGGFDWVLVDAPCTSTGTWRRNPDARLRTDRAALAEAPALQRHLARLGADALRPGGRLVYVTCSWRPAEDEAVVRALLADRPSLKLVSEAWPAPPEVDGDSFYVAVLEAPAR